MHNGSSHEGQGCRLLIKFAVQGDLRFISHRDTMRLFSRALVRAGLPVAYTQGFNPHVRVSILLPRPLGMRTRGDYAVVRFSETIEPQEVCQRLDAEMPQGAGVLQAARLEAGIRPRARSATYSLQLPAEFAPTLLSERIGVLLAADVWHVEQRGNDPEPRRVDIRGYIDELELRLPMLRWTVRFEGDRSVTPRDMCTALDLPWPRLRHNIIRDNIELE